MKRPPIPRKRVYDLYWHLASERQRIFERRIAGEPWPWTSDTILQDFKFCNTFRAADRVSQYLIRNVAYHDEPCSADDRLFQVIAFRILSKIETWETVREFLGGYPDLGDLEDGSFLKALDYAKEINRTIYTGAFILCASTFYGHAIKHRNHVDLLRHMFIKDKLGRCLKAAESLREIYEVLHGYPMMGDFMSYQIAIDLNYTNLVNFSENAFTQPGPGALRGIKKAFEDLGSYTPAETIFWAVERQAEEFERRSLPFRGLWGRPLHAIDCQGLFCETDKYCREAAPELKSVRHRIKARFSPSSTSIQLFFPPKWGINDKLPSGLVLGCQNSHNSGSASSLFQSPC